MFVCFKGTPRWRRRPDARRSKQREQGAAFRAATAAPSSAASSAPSSAATAAPSSAASSTASTTAAMPHNTHHPDTHESSIHASMQVMIALAGPIRFVVKAWTSGGG